MRLEAEVQLNFIDRASNHNDRRLKVYVLYMLYIVREIL